MLATYKAKQPNHVGALNEARKLLSPGGGVKAVINDPGVVATAEKVLKAAFGDKFRPSPPVTPSEDYSEFIIAGVPSMFFHIGVYEPEHVAAPPEGDGSHLPANHSPLFAPVPKPTIETGVEAMTLAVLSMFD